MIFINGWHFVINWFIAFLSLSLMCCILAVVLKKPLLKNTALLLFSLFLVLSIVEKYFSAMEKNYLQAVQFEILHNKIWLGRLQADFMTCPWDMPVKYTVSIRGFRAMLEIDSENAYVFLGCSFIFGVGVNDNETLPYYFLEELERSNAVYNFGIVGKGVNAALSIINSNIIVTMAKDKNIEHFFISLTHSAFYRPFVFTMPSDAAIFYDGKVSYQQQPLRFLKMLMSSSSLYNRFIKPIINARHRNFYYFTILRRIKEMQQLAQDKYGAKFTVILWYYNVQVKSFFEKNNIDFIYVGQLYEYFHAYVLPSGHPSPRINQAVARALFEHINRQRQPY